MANAGDDVNGQASAVMGAPGAPPPPGPEASADEKEAYWYRHVYAGDGVPQLTFRAVAMGAVIGCGMSIAHLYTSLKIGWGFGVAITACVLSYVSWNVIRTLSAGFFSKMTILENNCMQSTASAAGYSTGTTVSTAVAAMLLITGVHFHWTVLVPFVLLSGLLGVFLAIPMKRQMINIEQLRFPSGIAAAETLRSLYSEGREALIKAYTLIGGLFVGALVGVMRAPEGILHWLDKGLKPIAQLREVKALGLDRLFTEGGRLSDLIHFPASLASGVAAEKGRQLIGFGFEPSLLLIGAGMITGLRVSVSMLLGSILLYFVVGPQVIAMDESAANAAAAAGGEYRRHIELVGGGTTYHMFRWALWGGCAMMVFASVMSLALQWKTVARSMRLGGAKGGDGDPWLAERRKTVEAPAWWLWASVIPITIGLMLLQNLAFGTPWLLGALAVALAFVIALVCSRVTGETDTTPTGAMGKVTQLLYAVLPGAAGNQTINLMTAGVTSNAGLASADLLTDLKSGYLLGANPRQQFWAQLVGVFFGTAAVVAGWYLMIPTKEALEAYPAPATQSWKAVAEALTKGLSYIPTTAQKAAVVGALIGIVLPALERSVPSKVRAWLPSSMGLGLSWVVPFSNSLSFAIGALIAWGWTLVHRRTGEKYPIPLASGFIAGESLMAAIIAILCTLAGRYVWLAGTAAATP